MHGKHGLFNNVRGATLHRRIDGGTFRGLAARRVTRLDIRQIQTPSKQRFHIALVTRPLAGRFHVGFHTGIALKVQIHVFLRAAARDTQLPGQPEGRHTIDQPEIDGLGGTTLIRAHLVRCSSKYFSRCRPVYVFTARKRLHQPGITRQVSHDA